jgi:hypothetical protein
MKGFYTPYLFTGGGRWLKHHLLLVDAAGCITSIEPFQGETERTIACTGILFPALQASIATTPEAALAWLTQALNQGEGNTVKTVLERVFPCTTLEIGQSVALWNLEYVSPDACCLEPDSVIKQLYP